MRRARSAALTEQNPDFVRYCFLRANSKSWVFLLPVENVKVISNEFHDNIAPAIVSEPWVRNGPDPSRFFKKLIIVWTFGETLGSLTQFSLCPLTLWLWCYLRQSQVALDNHATSCAGEWRRGKVLISFVGKQDEQQRNKLTEEFWKTGTSCQSTVWLEVDVSFSCLFFSLFRHPLSWAITRQRYVHMASCLQLIDCLALTDVNANHWKNWAVAIQFPSGAHDRCEHNDLSL